MSFHTQTQTQLGATAPAGLILGSSALGQGWMESFQSWAGRKALLGLLPALLQADGISAEGPRARRVLREWPASSRQSFLGKPWPWERGQAWSCGHGTCQVPGRASTSCHAPLQGISTAWKRSQCSFCLHGQTVATAAALGAPARTAAAPCPPVSRPQGRVGRGAGSAREWPGGDHVQLITLSKTPLSVPSSSALTACDRVHKSSQKTLGEARHGQGKVTEVYGGNQQAENLPLIHHP